MMLLKSSIFHLFFLKKHDTFLLKRRKKEKNTIKLSINKKDANFKKNHPAIYISFLVGFFVGIIFRICIITETQGLEFY
jgi:hypothetical protein